MSRDEILNNIYGAHKYNFYKVSWNIKGPFYFSLERTNSAPLKLRDRGASNERKVSARLIPEADINSYGWRSGGPLVAA